MKRTYFDLSLLVVLYYFKLFKFLLGYFKIEIGSITYVISTMTIFAISRKPLEDSVISACTLVELGIKSRPIPYHWHLHLDRFFPNNDKTYIIELDMSNFSGSSISNINHFLNTLKESSQHIHKIVGIHIIKCSFYQFNCAGSYASLYETLVELFNSHNHLFISFKINEPISYFSTSCGGSSPTLLSRIKNRITELSSPSNEEDKSLFMVDDNKVVLIKVNHEVEFLKYAIKLNEQYYNIEKFKKKWEEYFKEETFTHLVDWTPLGIYSRDQILEVDIDELSAIHITDLNKSLILEVSGFGRSIDEIIHICHLCPQIRCLKIKNTSYSYHNIKKFFEENLIGPNRIVFLEVTTSLYYDSVDKITEKIENNPEMKNHLIYDNYPIDDKHSLYEYFTEYLEDSLMENI